MKKIGLEMSKSKPGQIISAQLFWPVWFNIEWRACLLEAMYKYFRKTIGLYADIDLNLFNPQTQMNEQMQRKVHDESVYQESPKTSEVDVEEEIGYIDNDISG